MKKKIDWLIDWFYLQGSLPDVDEESDRVLRGVKSQAMYGKVREEVDRLNVRSTHIKYVS